MLSKPQYFPGFSPELSNISNQMSTNSEQTTGKAYSVAAAAEQMSVNMVASAAEEMSSTITEVATNTGKI